MTFVHEKSLKGASQNSASVPIEEQAPADVIKSISLVRDPLITHGHGHGSTGLQHFREINQR